MIGRMHSMVVWMAEDVKRLRPDWSLERCEDELGRILSRLAERLMELGWDALDILLPGA